MKVRITKTQNSKNYRGMGVISGNGSSRLLLDYKYECPQKYDEIMNLIFAPDERGLGIAHLKIEMGSDINSSSGTEPCVKRYADEKADVSRGAGFIIAADAKKINPELTLDMLYWSEPAWVTGSDDVYAARYEWYMENLTAAYEKYGLKFDFVSVNRNEREVEAEWIKYFAKRLRSEKGRPYDFSGIKIVAADEENAWHIGEKMMADEELRNAVDIIGSHYTSHATKDIITLSREYGKEIWFSEGSPPMTFAKGVNRFDGSGLTGINGVLDVACRIAAMYPCGQMTMYEFQPAVAAYYDGVTYCHKQLIDACQPWCGYYEIDSGYYMALHLSGFFRKGWKFCDTACFCDGEKGGDGHALVNAKHVAMTAYDDKTGDYSVFIVNPTDKEIKYEFQVEGMKNSPLNLWETRGNSEGEFDENYFRKIGTAAPVNGKFSVSAKPYSLLTISTLDTQRPVFEKQASKILPLPYDEDFSYSEKYLRERGNAPRYTADQGGAFEVRNVGGKNLLMQVIVPETKAEEWGYTPLPTTSLGDDRWYNYEVSAKVIFAKSAAPDANFAGIGLRYSLASVGTSGYSLLIFQSGKWLLRRNDEAVCQGKYAFRGLSPRLRIRAENNKVSAYINDKKIVSHVEGGAGISAGRAALYSSYHQNCFEYIHIAPAGKAPYVMRADDTDECFSYGGEWKREFMSSFKNYKRTVSSTVNGEFTLEFYGISCGVFGENKESCTVCISIDGGEEKEMLLQKSGSREIFYSVYGLKEGKHFLKMRVIEGELFLDGAQVNKKAD